MQYYSMQHWVVPPEPEITISTSQVLAIPERYFLKLMTTQKYALCTNTHAKTGESALSLTCIHRLLLSNQGPYKNVLSLYATTEESSSYPIKV